jgi:hypothetical protein
MFGNLLVSYSTSREPFEANSRGKINKIGMVNELPYWNGIG